MEINFKQYSCRVILAAGGNPTGVVELADASNREKYPEIAKYFMGQDSSIEQFGFLEGLKHFQMSGGEFCGNAARAAAWVIASRNNQNTGTFTISGFDGIVSYAILENGDVRCDFPGFSADVKPMVINDHLRGVLVDLGGIVHFVLDPSHKFVDEPDQYRAIHGEVVRALGIGDKPAVGVIWQEVLPVGIKIHPVVWVRDIDSFFYETACGSGTLATLAASGKQNLSITQPSGQSIESFRKGDDYTLISGISEVS